jgi:hypothetical protein
MTVEDAFQFRRKDSIAQELTQQDTEFLFPFSSVGVVIGAVLDEAMQMRHLVREGDQESVGIQVMIDGDTVSFSFFQRAVISQLGGADRRDLKMDVTGDDPPCTDRDCLSGEVFGKDFFDRHDADEDKKYFSSKDPERGRNRSGQGRSYFSSW